MQRHCLRINFKLPFLAKEKRSKENDIAIGFMDESNPQNTVNTIKAWGFGKIKNVKNTTRCRTNTIVFYAIKGESIKAFLKDSKAESIAVF